MLTTCAPAQCSDTAWLGGGTLGQPGYGLFSRLNSTIRVSSIMDNQTAGFAQQMPLTSLPLDMSGSCPKEEYSNQVCGEWYQPCRAENDDTLDFVVGEGWGRGGGRLVEGEVEVEDCARLLMSSSEKCPPPPPFPAK